MAWQIFWATVLPFIFTGIVIDFILLIVKVAEELERGEAK